MALQKQSITLNFAQGLDTKTDPYQIGFGNFLKLVNSVFTTGKLLGKRNGFGFLPALPAPADYITTFQNALTAIGNSTSGNNVQALARTYGNWTTQNDTLQPLNISTLPLFRNNYSQSGSDTAIANGLVCTVYTDPQNPGTNGSIYYYTIADSTTGQTVIPATVISNADPTYGTPRVFANSNNFIIAYTQFVSSVYKIAYLAFPLSHVEGTPLTGIIATTYTPSTQIAWDGIVFENYVYFAYNGAGSSGIKIVLLDSGLSLSSTYVPDASHVGTKLSLAIDSVNNLVWIVYYNSGSTNTYALSMSATLPLAVVTAAAKIIDSTALVNLTSVASNEFVNVFFETPDALDYDNTIPFHAIKVCVFQGGGSPTITSPLPPGIGLASKAFYIENTLACALVVYQSPYQSTYFLMNLLTGTIYAKLAYENALGYLTAGPLPSIAYDGTTARLSYLLKTTVTAVNKNTNVAAGTQVNGIYSQIGVNLASFTFGTSTLGSVEIGNNLNITGGCTYAYDGQNLTEQGFHLYPDFVEVTDHAPLTPTGDIATSSNQVINISSMVDIAVGMNITGTAIPANTLVVAINVSGSSLTMSKNATGSHTTETITLTGNMVEADGPYFYVAVYEYQDAQGNIFQSAPSIPVKVTLSSGGLFAVVNVVYLNLTEKTLVKVCVYRWGTSQQVYYQTTSIINPIVANPGTQSITFIDVNSNATILGNEILYTNGGVLEDIGPPAFDNVFLFDDRMWGIVSEDKNLIWFSKQIIEGTPVEFSDQFTFFVAPSISAQGPTGPLLCGFPLDEKLVLFKRAAIYYINGSGPDNTGSNDQYSQPTFITSTVGCVNQKSIVFIPNGLMFEFQSEAGNQIYLLGRDLSTSYIGAPVEALTQNATVQSAINIPGTNQVRFTLSSGITVMYDYFYGEWGEFENVNALSSCIYQGLHTYINSFDQILQETPGVYLDGSTPVCMRFTTAWIKLAGLQGYQRAFWMSFLGTYYSPHKLQISVSYDYQANTPSNAGITPDNIATAYGLDTPYGQGSPYGGTTSLEQWRGFFQQQRCESIQITVQEIYNPALGVAAGAGLSISGIDLVIGAKKGFRPYRASNQVGFQ